MEKQGQVAILVKEKRLRLTSLTAPPQASIWPTAVGGAQRLRRAETADEPAPAHSEAGERGREEGRVARGQGKSWQGAGRRGDA